MTSKTPLQQEIQNLHTEIQNLEAKLQEFREQLNQCKEVTIETAGVGDTLEDGSIVLQKSNGLALLVSPQSTQVEAKWSKEFSEVFEALKSQGFNPSQWSVPTKEQLQLAYSNIPNEFSSTNYWSSTEYNTTFACFVYFSIGKTSYNLKYNTYCVRAFRCVTY
jgi:peptidoglycan hydrolase CwlO-like protein